MCATFDYIGLVAYTSGTINLPFTKFVLTTKFSDKQPNGARIYYLKGMAIYAICKGKAAVVVMALYGLYAKHASHINKL